MEKQFEDLTIGYAPEIDFKNVDMYSNGFDLMATPDGASYVIVYRYVNALTRTFNDREEAFYIDGINEGNKDKARTIFLEVAERLRKAYRESRDQVFNLGGLVDEILAKHKGLGL